MSKLLEFLGNDLTGCYRSEGSSQWPADQWHIDKCVKENKRGWIYYLPSVLSFGDYDNSCHVERSNVRVFLKEFKDNEYIKHHHGCYGWEAVWIDILCDDEVIIKTLSALADYPCMDDEDVSAMEIEMEQSDWESFIKRDFTYHIEKKFGAWESDMDPEKLWELYRSLCQKSNTNYIVQSGGNGYVDLTRLMPLVEQEDWMKLDFFDVE